MHNPLYTPRPHHTGKYLVELYKSEDQIAIETITKSEQINSLEKGLPALPLDTRVVWSGHDLIKSNFGWQLYDEGAYALNKADTYDLEKGRPGMPIGAHAHWAGKDYLKTAQGWKPVGKHRGAVKANHDILHGDTDKDHAAMVHDAGNMDKATWTAKHGENLHGKYKAVHDYLHKQKEIVSKTESEKIILEANKSLPFVKKIRNIVSGIKSYSAEEGRGDSRFIVVGDRAFSVKDLGDKYVDLFNLSKKLPTNPNLTFHPTGTDDKLFTARVVADKPKEETAHGIEVGKEYGHDLDGKVTVTKVEKNTGDKADKISHHVTYKDSAGKETTQGINGFKESTKAGHNESALARQVKEHSENDKNFIRDYQGRQYSDLSKYNPGKDVIGDLVRDKHDAEFLSAKDGKTRHKIGGIVFKTKDGNFSLKITESVSEDAGNKPEFHISAWENQSEERKRETFNMGGSSSIIDSGGILVAEGVADLNKKIKEVVGKIEKLNVREGGDKKYNTHLAKVEKEKASRPTDAEIDAQRDAYIAKHGSDKDKAALAALKAKK